MELRDKMKLSKKIEKLISSEFTAYRIGKETGVAAVLIQRLKNKERKIENLSLSTAEKLEVFYEKYLK